MDLTLLIVLTLLLTFITSRAIQAYSSNPVPVRLSIRKRQSRRF